MAPVGACEFEGAERAAHDLKAGERVDGVVDTRRGQQRQEPRLVVVEHRAAAADVGHGPARQPVEPSREPELGRQDRVVRDEIVEKRPDRRLDGVHDAVTP